MFSSIGKYYWSDGSLAIHSSCIFVPSSFSSNLNILILTIIVVDDAGAEHELALIATNIMFTHDFLFLTLLPIDWELTL